MDRYSRIKNHETVKNVSNDFFNEEETLTQKRTTPVHRVIVKYVFSFSRRHILQLLNRKIFSLLNNDVNNLKVVWEITYAYSLSFKGLCISWPDFASSCITSS